MHNFLIPLIALSLARRLVALLISTSPTSLVTTSPREVVEALFLLLPRSENNLLMLVHLFASNNPLHNAWRDSCDKWTRKSFLQIRNIITSSPNSLPLQAFLLDSWCIENLAFKVDFDDLIGLFGSLPTRILRSPDASVSHMEKLDVYGLWRRNIILWPTAFRVFDNVSLHRIVDPYQAARNRHESFQALLFVYGRRKLRQSDFEAVAGTIYLLIFPMIRPKASDIAQKLMQPSDPKEDQASLEEVLDICNGITRANEMTSLHSIATWMIESGILQGKEAKKVFPHSLINAESSHEITRLSLLLTLLSGTPSLELIQIIQIRLQKCPIIKYIDLLFAMSWTKPATSSFDTLMGSARSRLVGLSPRFLGKSKSVIISQLMTDERRKMFHNSIRTFADPRFNQLRNTPTESRIAYFYNKIPLNSVPPADFPNAQQFLITLLEDSLTRLVDLHVEKVDGQRTLAFHKVPEIEQLVDMGVISLVLYLQIHFDFKEAPVTIASNVREYIHDVGHDPFLKRLSRADRWV